MEEQYSFREVERSARSRWQERDSFAVADDDPRPKYFSMCMWPYPSGDLHVGHLRNYTIGDVWARHKRMQGFNVLQPMGWDAFGKDAELKARKEGVHPAEWVARNTANMKRELTELGYMIDWSRELAAYNPAYYRWEQLLFVRMWQRDLVYFKRDKVLWDTGTDTVTSRRDIEDGKVGKDEVEIREIDAYLMRMRSYANELLDGLATIKWPDKIVKDQQYLIGRSDGMSLRFAMASPAAGLDDLEVYTTRPDTIFGVTYMAVHADHPLARAAGRDDAGIEAFRQKCLQTLPTDAGNALSEKNGVPLGCSVIHPLTGEPIPVWMADYVIDDYGSGALMGVPAHDERDFNFATKYQIPIVRVIACPGVDPDAPLTAAEVGHGPVVNSGFLDGLDLPGCIAALEERLGPDRRAWRDHGLSLRDWPINRHMYWGTPIPIIVCPACGRLPVPENDLPVILPLDLDFGKDSLAEHPDFASCACPSCGGQARREADTMDTFVNSAWYYARYTCRDASDTILDERAARWLPCDHYFGGDEHAQGHLMYARFIHKVMRDLGMHPGDCGDEPFAALLCQGMVLGADGKKMSKSQDNTVMAKEILEKYGADTARMYIVGIGNPKDAFPWNEEHVKDHAMFLDSLWRLARSRREQVARGAAETIEPQLRLALNKLMHAVDVNLREQRLNNLVFGGIHSIRNLLRDNPDSAGLQHAGFVCLLKVLNIVSPHIAEAMWSELGFDGLLIDAPWWDELGDDDLRDETALFIIQVNGRKRDQLAVPAETDDDEVLSQAARLPNVARHIGDTAIAKQRVIRRARTHGIVSLVLEKS